MGCDIHLAVEVRRGGEWKRALPPEHARVPWLVESVAERPESWAAKRAAVEWYEDRNYRVFAVLADVRNSGEITPIDQPRGLPADMSDAVARLDYDHPEHDEDSGDVSLGEHSQSWLTLAELQAYPWDDAAVRTGVVPLADFLQRVVTLGDAFPVEVNAQPYASWSGGIFGQGIVMRNADEIIASIKGGGIVLPATERTYVRDQWIAPVRVDAGAFTDRLMPALAELGAPDDVRIVFGFDS